VNETLAALGLAKHPDKTFIGRVVKGFDFLGYRMGPHGLTVAKRTRERFAERAARLQEQERTGRASPGALGQYVRRRQKWARAGLIARTSATCSGAVHFTNRGATAGAACVWDYPLLHRG